MLQIACGRLDRGGWGLAPSEFWRMSPAEWWEIWDFNSGRAMKQDADTRARLLGLLKRARESNQDGGQVQADGR